MSEGGQQRNRRLYALFHGRVQGVSFRYFVTQQAGRLSLVGWVRNLPDGSVELLAEGPKDRLEALLQVCRVGPPLARVDACEERWEQAQGSCVGFEVRL